jgi:hypothetical protein
MASWASRRPWGSPKQHQQQEEEEEERPTDLTARAGTVRLRDCLLPGDAYRHVHVGVPGTGRGGSSCWEIDMVCNFRFHLPLRIFEIWSFAYVKLAKGFGSETEFHKETFTL